MIPEDINIEASSRTKPLFNGQACLLDNHSGLSGCFCKTESLVNVQVCMSQPDWEVSDISCRWKLKVPE